MYRIILAIFAASIFAPAWSMTGEEIIKRMDRNRDFSTSAASGTMTIHIDGKTRSKSMTIKSMVEGNRSLVEFTNAEDAGTRYLMIGKDLWIYFADEQDVVKISGHMLKEGMMGSDFSYEDALESDRLSDRYTITLVGEETLDNAECFIINLDATVKDVPYYRRKMWVAKDSFVALKEEMYAKSGKLLKVSSVLESEKIGTRTVPVRTEMVNMIRRNSKTVFELTDISFDIQLDEELFTMRNLRK